MKKTITCLLIAVMLIACLPITAFAAEAGDTVQVSFYAKNNPGFAAYSIELNYDDDVLELTDFVAGTLSSGYLDKNVAGNCVSFMGGNDQIGDDVLFTATFKIKSGAAAGTYSVLATLIEAYNSKLDAVNFDLSSGSVTVTVPHTHNWSTEWSKDGNNHWYACDGCTETKDLAAHTWEVASSTDATCTTPGSVNYSCNICGATKTETGATLEHSYEWTVTKAATCTEDGEETGVCECGATTTRPIVKLGHAWGEWTVTTAATCTEKGVETRTCANDATHTETRDIKATGHKWEWIVDKKPTATETGLKHEECSECHEKRNENTVIAKVENLDNVPQTGDITPQIVAAVVTVLAVFAVSCWFVFKRRTAK